MNIFQIARLPYEFARAFAGGVALGLEICYPMAKPPSLEYDAAEQLAYADLEAAYEREAKDAQQILADAEAEREVWEPWYLPAWAREAARKTSPVDGEAEPCVVAGPPAGERPSPDSAILPAPGEGHPNVNQRRMHAAAAYGLREWLDGESCTAPTYFASIVNDLEQFSK
jgi:hypothetical protein